MDKLARKPRGRQRGKLAFVIITLGALNIYISVSVSLTSSQVKDVFSNLSISLPDYGKRSLINKSLLAAAKKDYLSALSKVALSAHLEEITSKNALLPKEQHIVFIGDSLLRYSFLEWLDQKHFLRQEREYAPPELINEKFSSSWLSYFNSSTNHFQGNLYCDCRRSQNFSLNSEIENRYYLTDALWATYLQGYGDNMAHGRFLPLEANSSVISPADGPDKDTSHCKWGYMGEDWDKMISDYVSKFQRKPTAIVLNAGLWPNEGIRNNLGNILRASRDVMGDKGVVIWRGMTKMRDSIDASPSSSDVTARDWSYRLPWFLYQPFPKLNLSASDYMDDKHFSAPNVYRDWNVDLLRGIASAETPMHRVFILVGAVRTLSLTAKSILQNLIYPICSPPSCIAHLVHHLSFWDNRPSSMNNDPTGTIITSDLTNTTQEQFFDEWTDVFPDGFLVFHKVDGYNIGSPEEQAAMDTLEREMDPLVSTRMRLFRTGDPRRYSYWIARAWAWRHTQQLSKTLGIEFDFYTFARPDLLWMVPVSTKQFFDDFKTNEREAWVHDTYLGHIADTFAFLPNYESADIYFSIPPLLEGKVACLGGPDFNKTLVTSRLTNEKINFTEIDFCTGGYEGWSEQILQRKLKFSKVSARLYPAATVIVRPPSNPQCESVRVKHLNGFATYHPSRAPGIACLSLEQQFNKGDKKIGVPSRPFRLRSKKRATWSTCLSLNTTYTTNGTLVPATCQDFPYPSDQIFVVDFNSTNSSEGVLYGYTDERHPETFKLIRVNQKLHELEELWSFEHIELYSSRTYDPKTL